MNIWNCFNSKPSLPLVQKELLHCAGLKGGCSPIKDTSLNRHLKKATLTNHSIAFASLVRSTLECVSLGTLGLLLSPVAHSKSWELLSRKEQTCDAFIELAPKVSGVFFQVFEFVDSIYSLNIPWLFLTNTSRTFESYTQFWSYFVANTSGELQCRWNYYQDNPLLEERATIYASYYLLKTARSLAESAWTLPVALGAIGSLAAYHYFQKKKESGASAEAKALEGIQSKAKGMTQALEEMPIEKAKPIAERLLKHRFQWMHEVDITQLPNLTFVAKHKIFDPLYTCAQKIVQS